MILVRMVSATREPTATLPENSQAEAMTMACLRVREREETDVAKELATSLAPVVGKLLLAAFCDITGVADQGRLLTDIPRI